MSYPRSYAEATGLLDNVSADQIEAEQLQWDKVISVDNPVFPDPRDADEKLAYAEKLIAEVEVAAEKFRKWYT